MTTIFFFIANLFQAKPNRFFLILGVREQARERERGRGREVSEHQEGRGEFNFKICISLEPGD